MGEPFERNQAEYYSIKEWMNKFPGIAAGFTTLEGGHSTGCFESFNLGFHVGDDFSR